MNSCPAFIGRDIVSQAYGCWSAEEFSHYTFAPSWVQTAAFAVVTSISNLVETSKLVVISYAWVHPDSQRNHDDVMKWKHFPRYWPFVRGIHRSPVNSPHKDQWRAALMFSLICIWINGWVNYREAGDLRRHRAHYDVIVMYDLWHRMKGATKSKVLTLSIIDRFLPLKVQIPITFSSENDYCIIIAK